jgi:hypothetical protein
MKVGNIIKAQSEKVPLELNLVVCFGFLENPYDLGVKINENFLLFFLLSLSYEYGFLETPYLCYYWKFELYEKKTIRYDRFGRG